MKGRALAALVSLSIVATCGNGMPSGGMPSECDRGIPVGFVSAYSGELAIERDNCWVLADGRSLLIADYETLFAVIGWTYGFGTDAVKRTTFSLPDYRGYFLRGVSDSTGRDPDADVRTDPSDPQLPAGNRVGSTQSDAMQSHSHPDRGHTHETDAVQGGSEWSDNADDRKVGRPDPPRAAINTGHANLGDPTDSNSGGGVARHARETRPLNVYVYWLIKVR